MVDVDRTIAGLLCAHRVPVPRRRHALTRTLGTALGSLALFLSCAPLCAAARPETAASVTRASRDDAIRSIPRDQLDRPSLDKIDSVLGQVSIFRRLPTEVIECDPTLYLYLVEHPDLVVNMWEVMGVSEMTLEKTGATTFRANDGVGTAGNVEYLFRNHDTHIMYAEGTYEGPLFLQKVHGKCLLILRTGYVREPNDKYYITCRLDTFIQLQNVGVELVARTFQPLVGKTADHNFRETAAFLSLVSRSTETNPVAVQQLAAKLERVAPQDRLEFAHLAEKLSVAAAHTQRTAQTPAHNAPTGSGRRTTVQRPGTTQGR